MFRPTARILFALTMASPAMAWTLDQRPGFVLTRQDDGGYSVQIICRRGVDYLEFNYVDRSQRGEDPTGTAFGDITSLMVWVKIPDGRTDRWPVRVAPEGPSLNGQITFSDLTLEFFQNAESIEVTGTDPHHETIFRSGAQGTGAARIAFREQCGI